MRIRTSVRHLTFSLFLVTVTASLAIACSVPVFRYALEHWRPDAYVVFVFQNGDLTSEQQALVDSLEPISGKDANVAVKIVDLEANRDPDLQKVWQANQSETLPWVVLQSPAKWGPSQTVWQGELTADNVNAIVDSPARSKINKLLVGGESVVWVLLECGRKDEDDAAFKMLATELKKLQGDLKLPEIETEDLDDLSVDPDALKIAFSAVRISRDNAEERVLVEMLQRVEPDLMDEEFRSQPMAFPVFGRGRALYALIGGGIEPDMIREASTFLTGACQCTVKAQNPGVDLIMNVNWDDVVEPTEVVDAGLPPLAGFSGFGAADDEQADNEQTQADSESANTESTDNQLADNQLADDKADKSGDSATAGIDGAQDGEENGRAVAVADTASAEHGGSASGSGAVVAPDGFSLVMWLALGVIGFGLVAVVAVTIVILPRKE